ncbi:CBO0543 family protein [Gracilibacillus lacisalsi]|uniref:CBO0543 family protein n=1 Tax=Gracilibacillus lacisalsi TaxID=393087 RepID=UPI00035EAD6D|nr:CBO0543 family protein [Gracilibacillus lacisalsi]
MNYPSFEKILDLQYKLADYRKQYWIEHDLFTWQWWLLLLVFIIPWVIWYKVIPKEKKAECLSYGLLLGLLASQLDEIGINSGAWAYSYQLTQLNRGLNPYNFSFIPVAYMIAYYYFPKWKHFILANVAIAILAAFITEPILTKMGIYKTFYWKSLYSFPIYILLPIIFRFLVFYILENNKSKNAI